MIVGTVIARVTMIVRKRLFVLVRMLVLMTMLMHMNVGMLMSVGYAVVSMFVRMTVRMFVRMKMLVFVVAVHELLLLLQTLFVDQAMLLIKSLRPPSRFVNNVAWLCVMWHSRHTLPSETGASCHAILGRSRSGAEVAHGPSG